MRSRRKAFGVAGAGLSLQQMDKFDIAVAMLTMTQTGDILYDGTEKGRKAARIGNDYGARLMAAIERGNTEKLFPRFKV